MRAKFDPDDLQRKFILTKVQGLKKHFLFWAGDPGSTLFLMLAIFAKKCQILDKKSKFWEEMPDFDGKNPNLGENPEF